MRKPNQARAEQFNIPVNVELCHFLSTAQELLGNSISQSSAHVREGKLLTMDLGLGFRHAMGETRLVEVALGHGGIRFWRTHLQ